MLFESFDVERIVYEINEARLRVCYVGPGIDTTVAMAICNARDVRGVDVNIAIYYSNFYMDLGLQEDDGLEELQRCNIPVRYVDDFRVKILIIDDNGYALWPSPQSVENKYKAFANAMRLNEAQIKEILIQFSKNEKQEMTEVLMTGKDRFLSGCLGLINEQANICIRTITNRVIRDLQKIKRESGMMTSCEDSGLENLWDEICVQIQWEPFFFWNLYEDFVYSLIIEILNKYSDEKKKMMWLQTDEFDEWYYDVLSDFYEQRDEFEDFFPRNFSLVDVAKLIMDKVFSIASDYHNSRIDEYHE